MHTEQQELHTKHHKLHKSTHCKEHNVIILKYSMNSIASDRDQCKTKWKLKNKFPIINIMQTLK